MADAKQLLVGYPANLSLSGGFSTFALNGTTDQLEFVFQARDALSVARLGFRLSAITGTSPTFRISLQGVDASGNPDGTVKGGASPASATFNPTSLAWAAGWHWVTLANAYACTRGEFLAAVVDYSAGTINASNLMTAASNTSFTGATYRLPYVTHNDAGVRARQTGLPLFGYGPAGAAYGFPLDSASNGSVDSTNEIGLKFTLPAGWGDTFQVLGARLTLNPAAAQTGTLRLYQGGNAGDTTVLQDVAWDTDAASAAGVGAVDLFFNEATLSTLSFGSTYRLALQGSSATAITASFLGQASAADWDAWPFGQDFAYTARAGGNWTDTATRRPLFALILADWAEPAAGGGARLVGPGALVTPGGCT